MKTEFERISEIMYTLLEHQPVIDVPYEKINDIAVALVKEGYGKTSEYKADSKKKAIDVAYKEVVRIYPPNYMRSRLYEPYHKKDISVWRIDKLLFNEDGLTDIYMG